MNQWKKSGWSICFVCILGLAGNLFAQEDHLIENQRYVVGIDDFQWGDTYVGKYTSGNGLVLEEYIHNGETNPVTLQVGSLQIGSNTNAGNTVEIYKGGELQIEGAFTVLGTNNGNGLRIYDQGTLFVKSDFDASMGGFNYNSGANLMVGGEVSHLDNVEDGLNFTLTGAGATWNFGTNLLTIGALTDANSVTVSNNATLDVANINLGTMGTISNKLVVADKARLAVRDSIDILGASNTVEISDKGILAVYFDFAPITNLNISYGGILEAHKDLNYAGAITNGGGIIMTGNTAIWTTLSGSTLNIAAFKPNTVGLDSEKQKSFLTITNGATVRVGNFNIADAFPLSETGTTDPNEIIVIGGGKLIVENGGTIADKGARLWITEGGRLVLESDYNITGPIQWNNGGIIEAQQEAPVFLMRTVNGQYEEYGGLFLQSGQILVLNGSNAELSAPSPFDNLHVGDLTSGNALIITNGGQAFVNSVSVGDFKEGGNNNSIVIDGTNSALFSATYAAIGGTLDNGIWYEGGISNSITVGNGGLLYVGGTLHNRNTTGTSGLNIRPGGVVDVGNYYQANGAYLNIYTDSSGTNTGFLYVDDTAEFEAGAKIGFDAVAALDIGEVYTNRIVQTDTLIVDGITNATTADLAVLENTGGSLVSYSLWETNQDIYATFSRRSISDGGGFDPGSMLDQIGNEIDRLAALGNTAASNQVEILSGMGSDQARKLQMEQMYSYQMPTFMHNQGVFGGIDQVRARGASIHGTSVKGSLPKPKGVAGPHVADQGLQGWAKVYGSYGNRDKADGSGYVDGYDVQSYGTVIGMDQAFGEWLFGVAGGYAGSNLEGDNGDESDATTGYGILYANYGSKDWFGDMVVSYGLTSMDNKSGTDFDVTSSVDASQTAFYIGGGKEFKDPDGSGALLHPLLGLQVSQFDQDAYTEKSANAVAKDVDAYDRWSYQSILGATMILPSTGKTVDLETQLRAHWLHEFNGDEETVGYTLVGSSQPGQFVLRSPDQNVGQFGIGCVAKWKNGLQLRADLDGQVSSTFYSATVSGALLYEF